MEIKISDSYGLTNDSIVFRLKTSSTIIPAMNVTSGECVNTNCKIVIRKAYLRIDDEPACGVTVWLVPKVKLVRGELASEW
jgi:hypothetical protein